MTLTDNLGVDHYDLYMDYEEIEDNEPPTVPKNLKITNRTKNSVTLTWTASTDNIAVDYYEIYRNDIKIGESKRNTFIDKRLKDATKYIYKVKAVDLSNNKSDFSNNILVKTKESIAKAFQKGFKTTNVIAESVRLSFTTSTDNEECDYYDLYMDDVTQYDNEQPTAPKNLKANIKGNSATLNWMSSNDNNAIDYYVIYANSTEVGKSKTTAFTHKCLNPATKYTYKVKAIDKFNNESDFSNKVSVKVDIKSFYKDFTFKYGKSGISEIQFKNDLSEMDRYIYKYRVKSDGNRPYDITKADHYLKPNGRLNLNFEEYQINEIPYLNTVTIYGIGAYGKEFELIKFIVENIESG